MPHVVQSRIPGGNLSGCDSHNVGAQPVKRDLRSESLQDSGALVSGTLKQHQQRGKVALQGKFTPPPQGHTASPGQDVQGVGTSLGCG